MSSVVCVSPSYYPTYPSCASALGVRRPVAWGANGDDVANSKGLSQAINTVSVAPPILDGVGAHPPPSLPHPDSYGVPLGPRGGAVCSAVVIDLASPSRGGNALLRTCLDPGD